MAIAAAAVVGLGVGVAGTAVLVGLADGDSAQDIDPSAITLVAYDSCASALRELKSAALPRVGPYGLDGGAYTAHLDGSGEVGVEERAQAPAAKAPGDAAPAEGDVAAAPDHSGTNNYESDVDEPDIVKTDGRRVVSIAGGQLRVVDVGSHKQTAKVAVPGGYATQLLISGDRALVLISSGGTVEPMPRAVTPPIDEPTDPPIDEPVDPAYGTQLALVDLTGAGKVLGTLQIEGGYLDARQVGSVARVVVRSLPRLKFGYPNGGVAPEEMTAKNKGVLESSSISDWLPHYRLDAGGHRSSGELVDCTALSHPRQYTGAAMLSILSFDLTRDLGTGDAVGIAADGDTVYGTGKNLYIADDQVSRLPAPGGPVRPEAGPARPGGGEETDVYQFDISHPGRPVHVASGGVPGRLLNQYSLSEHEGNLRVATTTGGDFAAAHSGISVLTRRGKELAQVGRVDGLGKGEQIHAVRFLGDKAYVVTFRQTDPLYTVDLSVPAKPRVTGELKITGYSAYLHPIGQDRLLGIGQEATTEGMTTGTQVSLYDTSDQRGAKQLRRLQYPNGHSEVEGDPHAFLYWPDKHLVVIPLTSMAAYDNAPDSGALVLRVDTGSLSQAGMVRHVSRDGLPFNPRRALVIGDELWTISDTGMLVSDVDSLAQVAWVPAT
jgi:uncharacterized secreted protein with C-terminal beta-propeller domain